MNVLLFIVSSYKIKEIFITNNSLFDTIDMDALEKVFGKTAQMTVLKNLMDHPDEFTYLSGIAEDTGLSHSSVARVIAPLVDINIVIEKPLGKQIRTFRINMENNATKLVMDFYTKLNGTLV